MPRRRRPLAWRNAESAAVRGFRASARRSSAYAGGRPSAWRNAAYVTTPPWPPARNWGRTPLASIVASGERAPGPEGAPGVYVSPLTEENALGRNPDEDRRRRVRRPLGQDDDRAHRVG